MAGSYKHIVNDDGNLRSNQAIADTLENGGDVFECVEEMYGMIWYLAARAHLPLEKVEDTVKEAQINYKSGLEYAKQINGGG